MKQFTLHLLSIICICLLIVNCRHDPPTPPAEICQYDSSIEEMKKWYYFKTGSWWVYQEQTSGAFDTITVYYDWAGINTGGFEGFEWFSISNYDGYDYGYSFNTSFSIHCLTHEECICHKVSRSKSKPGDFVGDGQIFLYPLIEGNYSYLISSNGSQGGQTIISAYYDSLIVGSEIFYDVVRWEVFPDGSEGDESSIYLISKNKGIIMKALPDHNEIWTLINSSILQ